MSDLAEVPAGLTPFEGRQVIRVKTVLNKAGDGLSAAMAIEPVEHDLGDEGYVILRYSTSSVKFVGVKDSEMLERVETLSAMEAFFVDDARVRKLAEAHAKKVDKAKGVERLPFPQPVEDADEEGEPSE